MVFINHARATLKTSNSFYKTIINAKMSDQDIETINELGECNEDQQAYVYELSDQILVILWKN